MTKIYKDADDQYVATTIIYTKGSESPLLAYKDSACTEKLTREELKDAYLKGCKVEYSIGQYLTPVDFFVNLLATPAENQIMLVENGTGTAVKKIIIKAIDESEESNDSDIDIISDITDPNDIVISGG